MTSSQKRTRCRPTLPEASAETAILDLNTIVNGPVSTDTFKEAVSRYDFSPYHGKHIQLRGCAPAWAFLLVFSKLYPHVSKIDYLIDDGKRGIPVAIL